MSFENISYKLTVHDDDSAISAIRSWAEERTGCPLQQDLSEGVEVEVFVKFQPTGRDPASGVVVSCGIVYVQVAHFPSLSLVCHDQAMLNLFLKGKDIVALTLKALANGPEEPLEDD